MIKSIYSRIMRFSVNQTSMEPMCRKNDRMIGRYIKHPGQIKRGNIVIFSDGVSPELKFKRVIGLQREKIHIVGGEIFINNFRLFSDSMEIQRGIPDFGPIFVPENHFFLMGDNTKNSIDSRHFGPVPFSDNMGHRIIFHKALFIYRPFNHFKILI